MQIQEMKSGLVHLKKKVEEERRESIFDIEPVPAMPAILADHGPESPAAEPACELDGPRWSVVSFQGIEAGGLAYYQASALVHELDSHGIAGLCLVTDDAAARIS
jgi:hypothetical protein